MDILFKRWHANYQVPVKLAFFSLLWIYSAQDGPMVSRLFEFELFQADIVVSRIDICILFVLHTAA